MEESAYLDLIMLHGASLDCPVIRTSKAANANNELIHLRCNGININALLVFFLSANLVLKLVYARM